MFRNWGYVSLSAECPSGYTQTRVLGQSSASVSSSGYMCTRTDAPEQQFGLGGFYSQGYNNDATGAQSCPTGYSTEQWFTYPPSTTHTISYCYRRITPQSVPQNLSLSSISWLDYPRILTQDCICIFQEPRVNFGSGDVNPFNDPDFFPPSTANLISQVSFLPQRTKLSAK